MSCSSLLQSPVTSGYATWRIYYTLLLCFSVNCPDARTLPFSRPATRFVYSRKIKMKAIAYAAVLLGLVSTALGQTETLAPSPTESYGCEPHGDHW